MLQYLVSTNRAYLLGVWLYFWLLPTRGSGAFFYPNTGGSPILTYPNAEFTPAVSNLTRTYERSYAVTAIEMPIVYNKYGDIDTNGVMFTLDRNRSYLRRVRSSILRQIKESKVRPRMEPLVRPLVLRCNEGEHIHVRLKNEIRGRRVSLHPHLFGQDIVNDGSAAGMNPDSTIAFNEEIQYRWPCLKEGTYMLSNNGDYDGTDKGTHVHGLFAALVVEPKGSTWTDPITGQPTDDGVIADIHPATKYGGCPKRGFYEEEEKFTHPDCSFREFVAIFHDETDINHFNARSIDPCTNQTAKPEPMTNSLNYRSEPMRNRQYVLYDKIQQGEKLNINGEEQHHSSWMFGDPATPVFRAYAGDPVKFRVVHAGVKETHVFHLHVHQWSSLRGDRESLTIDSFSLSPQTSWDLDIHYGAGSRLKSIGDVIWHCHLYPHFETGMWGIFRVLDRFEDGKGKYPDGTPIERLSSLPTRPHPPLKDKDHPGFPNYIAGTVGRKSPRVPWPVQLFGGIPEGSDYRAASKLELLNMNRDPQVGNLFTLIPTPRQPKVVEANITITLRHFEYNQHGWHYPYGHLYMLEEEEKESNPRIPSKFEPLVLRMSENTIGMNKFTNKLPRVVPATAFDEAFPRCEALSHAGEAGMHVHLVKFDVLVSDGASVGWNYISGASFGKYLINRWWIDDSLGHIFFHDHLFANYRQKKGLYGLAPVEPEGSIYLNPTDLTQQRRSGVSSVILTPDSGQSFREQVQFIGDFAPAFDAQNHPINVNSDPNEDQGIMVFNYRNEPLVERRDVDPSQQFSSKTKYGDPSTTLFEAYPKDRIVVRLVQGAHEESHSFQIHGMRWSRFFSNSEVLVSNQQTIGISEGFSLDIVPDYSPGDHLYKLSGIDDIWIGCWGIIRVHQEPQAHLPPLPNNNDPFGHHGHTMQSSPYPEPSKLREYLVEAQQRVLNYNHKNWTDPFAIVYCLKVHLKNNLPKKLHPEPFAPQVPADNPRRQVSSHVSIHADLLLYDVRDDDGSNVGLNPDQTIPPGHIKSYTWYADQPLGPVLLQDFSDVRNHKHHGLVGALVILGAHDQPASWYKTETDVYHHRATHSYTNEKFGARSLIYQDKVLIIQSGLRLFENGALDKPIPDLAIDRNVEADADDDSTGFPFVDFEDQGQKAYNYRNHPADEPEWLRTAHPATHIFEAQPGVLQRFQIVGGLDKPRAVSFHLHGHGWLSQNARPGREFTSVNNAVSPGFAQTNTFYASQHRGDWVYRDGVLFTNILDGLWGLFRVQDSS
ncbi:hypothetical protein K493DRAFT_374135 [Basidiobolus meristosporus CBS 931.73]|uniref:Cupredoxin n=1 Tax=Basidiobolus meristosporus CBS 931.73 TaxID=1314790 RepID=A0A1Y1Y8H6_9FUNG|nr:hypothetical protein K493DRAFT_374135 [Basidiobolus meristosporus CBS 931.73]|eukprot:ORX94175.1 hypothetical protein K493DRAFT_374135 [Basidiobolus meristosporus CBS 931.73]